MRWKMRDESRFGQQRRVARGDALTAVSVDYGKGKARPKVPLRVLGCTKDAPLSWWCALQVRHFMHPVPRIDITVDMRRLYRRQSLCGGRGRQTVR